MARRLAGLLYLLLVAGCSQPSAAATHASSPSPPLPWPSITAPSDLIWALDGSTPPNQLYLDWTGGRFRVRGGPFPGAIPVPAYDGHLGLAGTSVVDWQGNSRGDLSLPDPELLDAAWADDNLHLCAVSEPSGYGPESGTGSLYVTQPGGPARLVRRNVGQAGGAPGILACSLTANRAVIGTELNAHIPPPQGNRYVITLLVQVIDLQNGAIRSSHDYTVAPAVPTLTSASPDGKYLAENAVMTGGITVKDAITGRAIRSFPNGNLLAFSWDDTLVALHVRTGSLDETRIVNLASGAVVWKTSGSAEVRFRQKTDEALLGLDDPTGDMHLIVVSPRGQASTIALGVYAWGWCGCLGARI